MISDNIVACLLATGALSRHVLAWTTAATGASWARSVCSSQNIAMAKIGADAENQPLCLSVTTGPLPALQAFTVMVYRMDQKKSSLTWSHHPERKAGRSHCCVLPPPQNYPTATGYIVDNTHKTSQDPAVGIICFTHLHKHQVTLSIHKLVQACADVL